MSTQVAATGHDQQVHSPGTSSVKTLSNVPTQSALRDFLQPDALTKLIQSSGIPEQLRAEHAIRGEFIEGISRGGTASYASTPYRYSITPTGNGSCLAADHQPRLRVNQDGQVEGLLALDVKMTIRVSDGPNRGDIEVAETLWVPIRNGQPLRNLRGFVIPCQDGEHYVLQESQDPLGTELLKRAVERSELGTWVVMDGNSRNLPRESPERWDPFRREGMAYGPGHIPLKGASTGEVVLDLNRGDAFDGRQITYKSGSKYHPAQLIRDGARVDSATPAIIPVLDGRPLTEAFDHWVVSSHGPWHLTPDKKFSGMLEISRGLNSTRFVIVDEGRPVQKWNNFHVQPLQSIEAPGAHVAALVTLTPVRAKEEQPQASASKGSWGAKPAETEPSKDRIVPFVDGKMITTIEASGQTAEIIEAKVKGPDGKPVPLEIRAGKVWTGTLAVKPQFSDRIFSVTIQDGKVATSD